MQPNPQKPNGRPQPVSMDCPNCGKLISTRAERCIHCGWRRPAVYTTLPLLGDLVRGEVRVSGRILLACVVLYLLGLLLDTRGALQTGDPFAMLSPSFRALEQLGMGGRVPLEQGRPWTLLTATYLHGGLLHILFNMLWLRRMGPLVEELFGASRFILLYTFAGLAGAALSAALGTPYFVGASGAVFGLFGALVAFGLMRRGEFGRAILRQSLFFAAFGFFMGLRAPNVDNWGHLGGFLAGLLLAALLGYQERRGQKLGHHLAAFVTLLGVFLCFLFMLVAFFTAGRG